MSEQIESVDILLIGAGIMSATLGMMLQELDPSLKIIICEKLPQAAVESSDAWNNAGTGHSAFCELNYTPERADGSIDISKAITIAKAFESSKEFWAYLVQKKYISDPSIFINAVPHMSFVWGEENIQFLKKRQRAMITHPLFCAMEYSEDKSQLQKWMPLMMNGRSQDERVAATFMKAGTDVNFGCLTRMLLDQMTKNKQTNLFLEHEIKSLKKRKDLWNVKVKDLKTGNRKLIKAKFVFIGAGGGALPLLEKSKIPESKGFGGFPVSGQWLICKNENIIDQHHIKAYGKAGEGSPPMSVPHLDTRIIKKKKNLLFGPYAGFTTKFLKHGSAWDLIKSIRFNNIIPMIAAGIHNIPLTKYLINQVTQTPEERLQALRQFIPTARLEDWELQNAGQRVQIIKKDKKEGGVLEFGTELVNSADGSIAALLGASPGASVAVNIMTGLLEKCFKEKMKTTEWKSKLNEMIPSITQAADGAEALATRKKTNGLLNLKIDEETVTH